MGGGYRVFILNEVHRLTQIAWTAFLEVTEEPPPKTIFIFTTTEKGTVPDNVSSRFLQVDLKLVGPKAILKYINRINKEEGLNIPLEALADIANAVDGHVRDAVAILEKLHYAIVALGITSSKKLKKRIPEIVRSVSSQAPHQIVKMYVKSVLLGGDYKKAMEAISITSEYEFFMKSLLKYMQQLCVFASNRSNVDSGYQQFFIEVFGDGRSKSSKVTVKKLSDTMLVVTDGYEMMKRYLVPSDIVVAKVTTALCAIHSGGSDE